MKNCSKNILRKTPGPARKGRRGPADYDGYIYGFLVYFRRTRFEIWIDEILAHEALVETAPNIVTESKANAIALCCRAFFRDAFVNFIAKWFREDVRKEAQAQTLGDTYEEHRTMIDQVMVRVIAENRSKVEEALRRAGVKAVGQPPESLQEVFDLNKRLLYETKRLRQEMQALRDQQSAFLAGLTANRPIGAPAGLPEDQCSVDAPACQQTRQGIDEKSLDSIVVPNAPVKGPSRPQVGPGQAAGLGLVVAKPAPGTRPQAGAQRIKQPKLKEGPWDIQGAAELGEAAAFDDMMNGR
jgi:hypothetical protein